jgi:hypothetical protein
VCDFKSGIAIEAGGILGNLIINTFSSMHHMCRKVCIVFFGTNSRSGPDCSFLKRQAEPFSSDPGKQPGKRARRNIM